MMQIKHWMDAIAQRHELDAKAYVEGRRHQMVTDAHPDRAPWTPAFRLTDWDKRWLEGQARDADQPVTDEDVAAMLGEVESTLQAPRQGAPLPSDDALMAEFGLDPFDVLESGDAPLGHDEPEHVASDHEDEAPPTSVIVDEEE